MAFKHPFFVFIRDDTTFLLVAPQPKSVSENIPFRRLLVELFALSARYLTRFFQRHFGVFAETDVCDTSVRAMSENPRF